MFELNENIKHGTEGAYNKKKCRCDLCKKAVRDYRKNTPIKTHGTKWGYDKGCRCDLCKKAKSDNWHKHNPNTRKPVTNIKDGTRKCTDCNIIKPLEEFTKNSREFLGRSYYCRVCLNKRRKINKNKPNQRFSVYKSGAKVRKIPFDLSFEDFILFWNKPCFYCNSEINGIGLDRKDPKYGYNLNNIVPCCSQCNRAKTIQTTDEFIKMCLKVSEKFKNYIVPLT